MWQSVHLPQSDIKVDKESIRAIVKSYIAAGVDVLLFDTVAVMNGKTKFGGTGVTSDWNIVEELMQEVKIPVLLAGGINPNNTGEALRSLNPTGIDLCSGVEAYPGKKDPLKLSALMQAVNEENKRRNMP
jgi:phosphoribosylanthranilate isomerase